MTSPPFAPVSRTRAALAACLAVAAAACAGAGATPSSTARCGEVETFPVQGGGHLIGDQQPPVAYNSTPPTSGWHSSNAIQIGPFDDALPEADQVSILEVRGVVITHGELGEGQRSALQGEARRFRGRVATTPYAALGPDEVVLAGWGALQRCDGVDAAAIEPFVEAYAAEEPDVTGSR